MNRVQILKYQRVIADTCWVAERFVPRLIGLMGKASLPEGEGMLFPKSNSVHMWFMSMPIDVVFLRKLRSEGGKTYWQVTSVHENVRPWKILPLVDLKANDVLELRAGAIRDGSIRTGDELCCTN